MSVNKQANSGMPDVSAHRELSPHEEDALAAGKSRWLPRIFQSYGTPIPELMASPLKTGLIFGAPIGILGAGLGSAIGGKNHAGTGALIGGLGAGGLAALAAGMDRAAKNEGLEELMRRMPEGAAKRDLEADPQYQSDFLGWDNNKIVATARARYYRPTERFSKRTFDMADARARYNERHKSSSVNKDVSMSQSEKQSMSPGSQFLLNYLLRTGVLGSAVGGAAGAITSKNKLRGMARGMLMGAGTGLGVGAGLPAGAGIGGGAVMGLTGRPNSMQDFAGKLQNIQSGAMLGAGTGGTLGGIAGYAGGKALADKLVGPAEDEDGEIKAERKKAAQALLDNTTLTLAEKMAAYKQLLLKQADEPIDLGPGAAPVETLLPALQPRPMPGPQSTVGQRVVTPPAGFPEEESLTLPGTPTAVNAPEVPVQSAPKSAPKSESKWRPPSMVPDMSQSSGTGGVRNTRTKEQDLNDKVYWEYFNKNLKTLRSYLPFLGEKGEKAKDSGNSWASSWANHGGKKDTNSGQSLLEKLNPYLEKVKPYAPHLAVGAGGLGALALAHYLSKSKKKKQRNDIQEQEQDEEYTMPKAAQVNWYQLARAAHRQKRAMVPPAVLNAALAAAKPTLRTALASRAAALPTWAKVLGTLGVAGGTGAGIGAAGNMLSSKDPSMLQQIMNYKYTPHIAAGVGTAGLLGGAAYLGSQSGKNDAKKKKKPEGEKQADLMSAGMGGAMGAGLGGLAGGLYGALAPGHEQDPETGRRRRRSRLMAALRGLAGGAALGGAGGAALGHFMPGVPHGAMDAVGMGKELELPMSSPQENMQANVAKLTPAQQKIHAMIMQRNKMKAPPTPDPVELARSQANMQAMGEEPGSDPLLGPNAAMQNQMAQQ